jgi:ceramide glucosyltransferase
MFEGSLIQWISNVFIAGATIGCVYTLLSAVLVLRHGAQKRTVPTVTPSISILKPLCGYEPNLLPRLLAYARQDYAGPVQIVFGAQDRADPAVEAVKHLQAAVPETAIDLTVDGRAYGRNRKVANLVNMSPMACNDVIVLSDSDIEVDPSYLADVVAALERPGVGVVTTYYHGVAGAGLWSQLSAMAINTYFLPNVVFAKSLGLAQPCFGATIAMRRETLDEIGGFPAFADSLADDYMVGQAVRKAGYDVAFLPGSLGHVCFEKSLPELLRHQMRQSRTIMNIDPIGYCGAVLSHPFALGIIGALLGGPLGLLVAAAALACRTALCIAVERALGIPRQPYWLIPVREVMAFAVFVSAYFGSTVAWRGSSYRVLADGTVVQKTN